MYETNFSQEIIIYDINREKAYRKVIDIYNEIEKYNKGKNMNEQILPRYPYGYRGIIGCLGVQCYSIMMDTYEKNHDTLTLCTGWNTDVLDTSKDSYKVRPGIKALRTLYMMGELMNRKI